MWRPRVQVPYAPLLILSVFTAEKPGKPRKYAIFLPFYRIYYSTIFCHRFCHGTYKRDSRDGQQEGRQSLLLLQVKRKLEKGKNTSEIAEDLEQEEPVIRELIGKLEGH